MLDIFTNSNLILGITTPITLIAFFISIYYGFKYRKSKTDIEKLKTIPDTERAGLLKSMETDYPSLIELNSLTKEQKYSLALEQIKNKEKERRRKFYLALIIALFVFAAVLVYALIYKPSTGESAVNNPGNIENLKKIYPKLEQLIAIYSLIAWRSPQQNELKITEDNNIDGAGRSFNLECSKFTWNPYVVPKPGQLFDCFSETTQLRNDYDGELYEVSKIHPNYEYWYDFKWESLFGYELNVTINPDYNRHKDLYELKEKLSIDSNCLTELAGLSNNSATCSFNIYLVNISALSVSKEVTFLVSDGYLHWNSNGSVDRIDEWCVYLNNTNYISAGSLKKFIQLLLRKLQFPETDLAKVIPAVEAKWNGSKSSIADDLLKDTKDDEELKNIAGFLK